MGQKVHPYILRIGINKYWQSLWFSRKLSEFSRYVEEDYKIRKIIKDRFKLACISKILIERLTEKVKVRILTARPGMIIGRHGQDIERLREDLNTLLKREITIDVQEIENPACDAQLVAENIAFQIEKRVNYRRAVKRAIEQAVASGAKGIRVTVGGRLAGAEISRSETYKQGKIPLSTFRADIDHGQAASFTTYGYV
ncbi:MAG: 30S ribosomal protein S3, partial [Candidatus Omnitrophica bacterium]|nr:30S ribosomal protein S3 [Candidatus Omnitrophota bacterium]